MRNVHWISRSKDKKLGDVLASYSPKETCPDSCSLKNGGCYAWGLFYLNILGKKISEKKINVQELKVALKQRSVDCKIARHRVMGDIVGDVNETLNEIDLIKSSGLINIGYTHDWRSPAAQSLKKYFRASCQNMKELEEARKLGWSTTLIVSDVPSKVNVMKNGEKAVLCPARVGVKNKKDITCNSCTLCRVDEKTKDITILFKAHGNNKTIKEIKGKI